MEEEDNQEPSKIKEENNSDNKLNFKINQTKENIPVKTQIKIIEKDLAELYKNINHNKKLGNTLKGQLIGLEGNIKDKCNNLSKIVINDLLNFEKDLKRVIQNERNKTYFFKTQIVSIKDDQIKIKKETISLGSRISNCEIEVGTNFN